jgi:hypothetical protein
MDMPIKDDCMELIKYLHDTNVITYPVIENRVNRAINTGNCAPLYKFLNAHPFFLALADRNRRAAEHRKLDCPFDFPDRDDIREYLSGPLKVGYVNPQGGMFGFHYDVCCLPIIIPGRVGGGKSHLNKYMLIQMLRRPRDFNIIIPDLKGTEYRNLLPYCKNLKVLTTKKIKLNPLQTAYWMTPMEYIVFFSKVFTRENFLMSTSESILIKLLGHIYRKRGIFDGSENWPTLLDLYNVVSHRLDNEKSFRYRDVLLLLQNRLDPYIYSENFNYRKGIPHDVWRTENVVLELGKGFTDNMYSFLISYIAGLRYTYNLEMGLVGAILRTLIEVDEGRLLFRPRDQATFGESYITELSTRFRDPGIGLILSSHETSSFNQTIRSISYTKVCFPLTDGDDIHAIKESFGLNDEQAEYLFKLPRHGQAIVRYGGYENPFLLVVPYLNLKKTVTDEEVEARMADFYAELRDKMKIDKEPIQIHHQPDTMPPNAVSLLYFLSKKPFTRISDMTNAPGFNSPADVYSAHSWLEKNGFVKQESHKVSRRGRKSIFAVLTPKAYKYLKIKGIPGKGEFEHKLYQHLICKKHKKDGLEAKIEGRIKGFEKSIDVLARSKNGNYIAYEVTLHLENLLSNIRQNIAAGVSKIVIVTRDTPAMEKAAAMVNQDRSLIQNRARVTFCTISDFFN